MKPSLLSEAREEIDRIDREMAALFEARMAAAKKVALYKKETGMRIFDPAREEEVLRCGARRVKSEIIQGYYVNFLRAMMDLSKAYQSRLLQGMHIAFAGVPGAFAQIAAKKIFPDAATEAFADFAEAYRAVEDGDCDAAVLPVENSYNGEVGQVTDLMFSGSLYVNAMIDLAVSHDLLVVPGTAREEIKTVLSHPQALGQCAEYIRKHGWTPQEYTNTALAARYVAEKRDPTVAAIASEDAAGVFGLEVMERNINASRSNTTRFAVFSRSEDTNPTRKGETFVLVFTVKHEAGSLARAINVIGQHGFNMRTLRSRPMKELLWQYYFYVEAEGNVHTEDGRAMLCELENFCDRLKLVGTYAGV